MVLKNELQSLMELSKRKNLKNSDHPEFVKVTIELGLSLYNIADFTLSDFNNLKMHSEVMGK
jgi:hypothetical protein